MAYALAVNAGSAVPPVELLKVAKKPALLVRRFDREGALRIPFLSAMSMLGAKDNETRSYLEIVDALRQHGAAPKVDIPVLNLEHRFPAFLLVGNTLPGSTVFQDLDKPGRPVD